MDAVCADDMSSLRGPAPLHHTLLRRLNRTGVTLQTLHPKHFDEGRIIDQTPRPGLPIPEFSSANVETLLDWIGPLGAEMLYKNIMNGNFATTPDSARLTEQAPEEDTDNDLFGRLTESAIYPRHARKIVAEDRHLSFGWPVDEIVLRDRVLGRLFVQQAPPMSSKRVTFHGLSDTTSTFQELSEAQKALSLGAHNIGSIHIFKHDKDRRIFFQAQNGFVSPAEVTIEGKPKQKASSIYQHLTQSQNILSV